jgi:hypothetical protein
VADLLYSKRPRDAKVEAEMRQWFRDNFGEVDAKTLIDWVWENHKDGIRFVDALVEIGVETQKNGKQFVHNLLEVARKPKHVREAEIELLMWVKPRLEKAVATVLGHRGDPDVKRQEFDGFLHALEDKLWNMYPSKHRATMKGAILSAFHDSNGRVDLNIADLVKTLNLEDPLSATANTAGRR